MALSASFSADFSKFTDACVKAELSLKGFEDSAGKVTNALNRMGDSFSGVKVVQQATLMASAVAKIGGEAGLAGGLLKLTDGELKRLGDSATAAAQKLDVLARAETNVAEQAKLLAQSADFKRIATEAQAAMTNIGGIKAPTDGLVGSVTKLAGAFGLAFTGAAVVSGIKNLIGNVLDSASAIHDQSAALGFSAEAFQRNAFAAEQSGGSLEAFSKAANKLNDNLANGSDSTVAALAKAGLKFEEIRRMKPEEAWAKVTDAVGQIPDPMQRAAVAQDLFGKGALELLPGMIEGYEKLGKAASVMSDDTVARLEAAQDAWDKFGKQVTIISGETIGGLIRDFDLWRKNLKYLIADLQNPFAGLGQMMAEQDRANATAAQVVEDALKKTHGALDKFDVRVVDHTKTLDKAKTGTDVYAKSVQALADVFTGKHLDEEVKKIADAVTKAGGAEKITTFEGEKLTKQLQEMQSQGAKLSPVLLTVISRFETWSTAGIKVQTGLGSLLKLMPDVTKSTEAAASGWLKSEEALGKLLSTVQSIAKIPPVVIPIALGPAPPPSEWDIVLKGAKEAFAKIPDLLSAAFTGGGDISGAFKAIGVQISAAILVPLQKTLKLAQEAAVSVGVAISTGLGQAAGLGTTTNTVIGMGTALAGTAIAAHAASVGIAGMAAGSAGATVAAGALTLGIGAAAVGVALLIKHWNDHRKEVNANTKSIADFEHQIQATLTPTEAAEAAGRAWAATTIGVRDAYLATGRSALQAEADVKALWESAKKGAGATQAAIDKINQAFIEQKQLAQDLSDAQVFLDDTIKKYGFSIDELGPKFREQKLTEQAELLVREFTALTASGIEVGVVTEKMTANVNEYIQAAIRTGTEVPEAMRPMLEKMVDMGELTDDTGQKMTDLTKLSFSTTLTKGFQSVVDKLQELITKLFGLPAAANNAANQVAKTFDGLDIRVPINFDVNIPDLPSFAGQDTSGTPIFPEAKGGDFLVTKPTLFLAGEKGPERATFSGAGKTGGSGVVNNVSIAMDMSNSHFPDRDSLTDFARKLVPALASEIERLGISR